MRTSSVGFADVELDERGPARAVAEALGTAHEELVVETAIADDLPEIAAALEQPQVLGHRRLRDAELLLDHAAQLSGGGLSVGEQLEDAASHGVPEDVERVHGPIVAWLLI